MEKLFSGRIKILANAVEKFVEHNLMEKEHREENIRKLALAFEQLKKQNPIKFSPDVTQPTNTKPTFKSNNDVVVQIKKLSHFKGELPKYQSSGASGLDVRAQLSQEMVIEPGARALIPTGIAMAIPEGYEVQARPRSGLAMRDGISLLNTPGTIDADYRGEIKIILVNLGENTFIVKDQDRIAQLVVCPVIQARLLEVEELDTTLRGAGGFGSTGRA